MESPEGEDTDTTGNTVVVWNTHDIVEKERSFGVQDYWLTGLYAEIFPRGGGKFGVWTKEGGGSLCEVLHPTLARGAGRE